MRAASPGGFDKLERYKPYSVYKDSGVEWLGEIPDHWGTLPIKRFAKQGRKTFVDGDWIEAPYIRDEGIRLLQTGNIGIGEYIEQGFRYISEETFCSFRCTEVKAGDVLICRLAEPVGRACRAPNIGVRMVTSVDVCILKTFDCCDSRFIIYVLSSPRYLAWVNSICRGSTRDRISRHMLGSIRIQAPKMAEQKAIAKFLDQKTAKIDALISKQERLVELLQEKRAALITNAVTKGLDPDVPMKDPGMEWLGEVPAHWDVKKITWIYSFGSGTTPQTDKIDYYEGNTPWVTTGELRENVIESSIKYISDRALEDYSALKIYPAGSLLIAMYGATIGRMGMLGLPATVNQACCVLYQPIEVCSKYTFFWLLSYRPILVSWASGGGQPNLSQDVLRTVRIPLPPMSEQQIIVTHIEKEIKIIDDLVAGIYKSILLLGEYRTALISAAVTGKIDVREEVP